MAKPGPQPRRAFPYALNAPKPPGPARLWKITDTELTQLTALIEAGTSPHAAAVMVLGVSSTAHYKWMKEGEIDEGDPRCVAYARTISAAQMRARSKAETRVLETEPLSFLTRGPAGKPDWQQAVTLKHTDHTGEGDPVLRVKLHISPREGIRSELVREVPRELSEGDGSDEA